MNFWISEASSVNCYLRVSLNNFTRLGQSLLTIAAGSLSGLSKCKVYGAGGLMVLGC